MNQRIERRQAGATHGLGRRRRGLLRGLAVTALATIVWTGTAGAALAERSPEPPAGAAPQASPPPDCISPDGTNLNQLLGTKTRIIGPPACRQALAGEKWIRVAPGWVTAASAATAVYPAGYTPQKPNPIDDFNAKFRGARYVQDRGTPQEKTFVFGRKALRTGFFTADGLPYSMPVSPPFKPLSVGQHTSTVFLRLSAEHCDGLGTNREENCLPGGEFQYTADTPFEVLPRYGR